jgi:hypothetical protein
VGSFQRVDTSKLVRGAGRLMYAASSVTFPTQINDVVKTASGATQWDAQTGWNDLGATVGGIAIEVNNTETSYDIDQIAAAVGTEPDAWTCQVTTALAEYTIPHLILAWEGSGPTENTTPTPDETTSGFAGATSYTERRLAVLFQRPPDDAGNQYVQMYAFRRAVRSPQAVTINFQKGGNALTIPIVFTILADDSVTDPRDGFGTIFDQHA